MRIFILKVCLILTVVACEPTLPDEMEGNTEPVMEHEIFQMQWATRMEPDRTIVTINDVQQYEDIIIKSGKEESKLTTFYLFDKDNGEMIEKITLSEGDSVGDPDESLIFENIYVVQGSKGVLGYNLDEAKVDWKITKEALDVSWVDIHKSNDRLFYFTISKDADYPTTYEVNPMTGELNVIFSLDTIGAFSQPGLYTGPEFEHEVAFMAYYPQLGTTPPQLARQDMIAVDVVTKEILWRTTDFSEKFPCNYSFSPIIHDGVVMIGGDWSIYGFDMLTGEQLWRTEVDPENGTGVFARTEHLLHNGLLYVNSLVLPLACIEPSTGEMLWRSLDAPNCSRKMHYDVKNDWLVIGSIGRGSVLVFDAKTGALVHREHRYENSSYGDNVIYDESRDMYFTNTFAHTMGFKLVPE